MPLFEGLPVYFYLVPFHFEIIAPLNKSLLNGAIMNTALSIIDDANSNTAIDYRQEMNVIHEIVAECEKEIAFMYQFTTSFMATNATT